MQLGIKCTKYLLARQAAMSNEPHRSRYCTNFNDDNGLCSSPWIKQYDMAVVDHIAASQSRNGNPARSGQFQSLSNGSFPAIN